MHRQMKIALSVLGVLALVSVGVVTATNSYTNKRAATATKTVTATAMPTPSTVSYAGVEGKTALELLKAKDSKAVAKGEGANAYVTTINGYTASEAKKEYWALYVNGKMSDVGAGSYMTKAGDQIEWKIATY